jgi:PadR family transcriptional regulator AphA
MQLSKHAYTVLGMLRLGRRTGYEIKNLVDVSTRFFWAASYGQIYPELGRLERLGLIEGKRDDSDGRRRKAYELTAAGEAALRDWLASSEPLHCELRHEGVLKLFLSDALDPEERVGVLRSIRSEHEGVREQLRAIEPAARHEAEELGHEMPLIVLRWGIAYEDFVIDWCSRLEHELAAPAGAKAS